MTEFEKKILLSKEEYDYLMEHLGYVNPLSPKSIVKQINYYFDTDDLSMNHQNITCRIRLNDGKYTGTMKSHFGNEDKSAETEMEVRDGIQYNAFTDMGLTLQGELTTYRCIILKDEHYKVILDKNEYLDTFDYELEIEYLPEYEKDAQAIYRVILDMLIRHKYFLAYKDSYEPKPNAPSKSKRFFDRMSASQAIEEKFISEKKQNNTTSSDYSDPDDYLYNYFDSIMPGESIFLS